MAAIPPATLIPIIEPVLIPELSSSVFEDVEEAEDDVDVPVSEVGSKDVVTVINTTLPFSPVEETSVSTTVG